MTEPQLQSNIKKLYGFRIFTGFLVIISVFVPFLQNKGFTMAQVFELQAIFGISMALFEIPSGYLSDLWGRKKVLILGALLNGIGFTLLIFIDSYYEFVIYEIILGIGLSMLSGSDISLLLDSLKKDEHHRESHTKVITHWKTLFNFSEGIASCLGGLLAVVSFTWVVNVQCMASWIPFLISLFLKEPNRKKMGTVSHLSNFKKIIHFIFLENKLISLIFINMVVWSLSTFIAVWIFQKYWQIQDIPIHSFGFIWAGYNIAVGLVSTQVPKWEKRFGPITLLFWIGLLPVFGYFAMAYSPGWLGVFFGLTFQITRGLSQVLLFDALNWRLPTEFKATANSLVSFSFRGVFFIVGPLVGQSIDKLGVPTTLKITGGVFLLLLITLLLPLIKKVKVLKPEGS